MERYVKYNAQQSAPLSVTSNIVDFDLPPASYDLSKSFVNFQIEVTTEDSDPATGNGVYNYQFDWLNDVGTATNYQVDNVAFIRNARFEHDGKPIEDIREVGLLRQQQKYYSKSLDDFASSDYENLVKPWVQGQAKVGPGLYLRNSGSVASESGLVNMMIPLKDIFNSCALERFPADKMDNLKLRLEMDLKRLGISQIQGSATTVAEKTLNFGGAEFLSCEDITGVTIGDEFTSVITSHIYNDMKNCPFYVGQKLTCEATLTGATVTPAVISQIQQITNTADPNCGRLTITFASTFLTALAVNITNINLDGVDAGSISYSIINSEISLKEIPSMPVDELQFTTFKNEADSTGSGQTEFNKQYYLPSECMNVYVVPKVNGLPINEDGGANTIVQSWRLRVDNEDITDRDVDYNSPLYHEACSQILTRSLLSTKNVKNKVLSTDDISDLKVSNGDDIVLLGSPVPLTERPKSFEVNLSCYTASCPQLQIYKECVKTMAF